MNVIKPVGSYPGNGGNGSYAGGAGSYAPGVTLPPAAALDNLLADSHQFATTEWGGAAPTGMLIVPGQSDAFGGNTATVLVSTMGLPSLGRQSAPNLTLDHNNVVLSLDMEWHQTPSSGLELLDGATPYGPVVTWTAGVPSFDTDPGWVASAALISPGWYRVSVVFDLVALGVKGNTNFTVRILPWLADTTGGNNICVNRVMLNEGATEAPYVEKP